MFPAPSLGVSFILSCVEFQGSKSLVVWQLIEPCAPVLLLS